jgi:PST family polysaccharide transporter
VTRESCRGVFVRFSCAASLSIVVSPALLFFVSFYFMNKEIHVFKSISRSAFDFEIIKFVFLFSYGTGFIRFRTYGFAIRNNIIQTLDYSQAGYWETMMRISTYYMLL